MCTSIWAPGWKVGSSPSTGFSSKPAMPSRRLPFACDLDAQRRLAAMRLQFRHRCELGRDPFVDGLDRRGRRLCGSLRVRPASRSCRQTLVVVAKDGDTVAGRRLAIEHAANDRAAGIDGLDKEDAKRPGITLAACSGRSRSAPRPRP